VKQLERLRGTPEHLLREWRPPLLAGEAGITDLLNLVDDGQPADQLLAPHLAQCGEVDVAEALVPPPGVVVRARREAHRTGDGDVEVVQPAWAPKDLREEAPVFIAYPHHAVLHQHLVAALVELADGDDVGGEAG
jgi:hypothetical protein